MDLDSKLLFSVSFLIFFLFFYLNLLISKKLKIYDFPGDFKIHKQAKLSAGGLLPTLIFAIFLFQVCKSVEFNGSPRLQILPLIFFLFYLSAIYDFFINIPAVARLFIYITLSYISLSALPHPLEPSLLSHIPKVLVFFIVYYLIFFINVSNFSDGLDGNLFIMNISITSGILILDYFTQILSEFQLIVVLLIFAFFVAYAFFNFYPAKIFLSDIGTIPLSFLLGWLLLTLSNIETLPILIILPMYYFVDIGLTIILRIIKRKSIFIRHNSFFFHRMKIVLKYSNYKINIISIINNIYLIFVSYLAIKYDSYVIEITFFSLVSQIILLISIFKKELWNV